MISCVSLPLCSVCHSCSYEYRHSHVWFGVFEPIPSRRLGEQFSESTRASHVTSDFLVLDLGYPDHWFSYKHWFSYTVGLVTMTVSCLQKLCFLFFESIYFSHVCHMCVVFFGKSTTVDMFVDAIACKSSYLFVGFCFSANVFHTHFVKKKGENIGFCDPQSVGTLV